MEEKKPEKNITEEFLEAIKQKKNRKFILRLFITGITPRSIDAVEEVRKLCEEHLKGHYELEVIDLYTQPQAASTNQIIAAPTLIKLLPLPVRKIVGDMTEKEKLLAGLDIQVQDQE